MNPENKENPFVTLLIDALDDEKVRKKVLSLIQDAPLKDKTKAKYLRTKDIKELTGLSMYCITQRIRKELDEREYTRTSKRGTYLIPIEVVGRLFPQLDENHNKKLFDYEYLKKLVG